MIALALRWIANPRVLMVLAAVIGLLTYRAYTRNDARLEERSKWKQAIAASDKLARQEERKLFEDRIRKDAKLHAQNQQSLEAATNDITYLREELARAHALSRTPVPTRVIRVLDARTGPLPGTSPIAGGYVSGTAEAVPGIADDQAVALGMLLERVRENSGICQRNEQRLSACLIAYDQARDLAIQANEGTRKSIPYTPE